MLSKEFGPPGNDYLRRISQMNSRSEKKCLIVFSVKDLLLRFIHIPFQLGTFFPVSIRQEVEGADSKRISALSEEFRSQFPMEGLRAIRSHRHFACCVHASEPMLRLEWGIRLELSQGENFSIILTTILYLANPPTVNSLRRLFLKGESLEYSVVNLQRTLHLFPSQNMILSHYSVSGIIIFH
jgi:hypothetical protein